MSENLNNECHIQPAPGETISELASYMAAHALTRQVILDYGCGSGRNSRYLSEKGHHVVAVSNDFAETRSAAMKPCDGRVSYVVGDARQPMFSSQFDAVLSNQVLHLMSKRDSRNVLRIMRGLTKIGGLNAVSGYLVTEDVLAAKNREQCFVPGELASSYLNTGWQIIDYREVARPVQTHQGQELVSSTALIIARKSS
ncbi:class I SAM-dependent methyltransferase [Polaromonas sp.]|nr:class I SAM-dependent methyltransferase [Candidatus Saccharibacteria bacterium]